MFRFSITKPFSYLNIVTTGPMGVDDAIELYSQIVASPDFKYGINSIVDLSQSVVDVSVPDMEKIIQHATQVLKEREYSFKSALIVSDDLEEAMVDLYNALRPPDLISQMRVFHNREKALSWLSSSEL